MSIQSDIGFLCIVEKVMHDFVEILNSSNKCITRNIFVVLISKNL